MTTNSTTKNINQNRPRTELHGLLLVDKPSGMTSHDVVSQARKLLGTKEVGHTGTLDPLASGLMVILVGEATKLSSIVTDGDKSYQVQVQLGVETDTLDITGEVLRTKPVTVSSQKVIQTALALAGTMNLPIPIYSAKKIDGKKLYEYAREGQAVEIPSKPMTFWDIQHIENTELEKENKYSFHLSCSKGSFIRSWVKLLGEALDCGATMSALRRTQSHQFQLDQALQLGSQLLDKKAENPRLFADLMIPMDLALLNSLQIKVSGQDEVLLNNGQISHDLRSRLIILFKPDFHQWVIASSKESKKAIAIIGLEPGIGFKIKRGFRY